MKQIFLAITLLFMSALNCAIAQERLLFSGFGFTGNEAGLYPISFALAQQKPPIGSVFDAELLKRLRARPAEYSRVTTQIGEIGKGTQVSVAFALDGEEVEYQKAGNVTLGIFTLYASVLAFDRDTKMLSAAYPFSLSYRMQVQAPLGRAGEQAVFSKLYFTNDYEGLNVFDTWIDNFSKIKFKQGFKYIQVKNINLDPDALQTIKSLSGKSEKEIKNQVANFLESQLSEANQIPIVPSSIGGAGNKMAYRFSNGNVELQLPSPDFEVTFTMRGFRTKAADETSAITHVFRALGTIKIEQADSNNIYIDEKVNGTVTVRMPKSVSLEVSIWPQYYKALLVLIKGLSLQFNKVDSGWLEENAARGTDAKDAFVKTSELFKTLK